MIYRKDEYTPFLLSAVRNIVVVGVVGGVGVVGVVDIYVSS